MPPKLIETTKTNFLKVTAVISAVAIGIVNAFTLTGVLPVVPEFQTALCLTPIVPVLLFIASLPGRQGKNKKLFDRIVQERTPGIKSARHNKLTGRIEINYGQADEKKKKG